MKEWSQGRIETDGLSLRYFRSGGALPPLVLVHGFTDNALYYTRLADRLASEWDVVAYDCRGHGQSDRAGGRFEHEDRVADLVAVLGALALDRPALIGHSMGAATIARAVAEHSNLSRGIVLEDPAWWEPPADMTDQQRSDALAARVVRNKAWLDSMVTLQNGTWEEALVWRRSDSPLWSQDDVELSAASRFEVELDLFNYFPPVRSDYRESVRGTDCPALLVCGDPGQGAIITAEQAAEVATINPLFQIARVAGAGHAIRYDQVEAFCGAVLPFLHSL
jgi:N-formylmaleamate deformylase